MQKYERCTLDITGRNATMDQEIIDCLKSQTEISVNINVVDVVHLLV